MDNCLTRLNEALDSLSKKELKVANYILKHSEEVSKMTVAELSKKCKTSTATIMRLCYSLKYSGYKEFIKALYSDIANHIKKDETIYDIDNEDVHDLSIESIIYSVSNLNINCLNTTLKIINPKDVEKAVELIHKATKVNIYALSGSKVVAYDAFFKFQRLGIDVQAFDEPHSQLLSASVSKPTDVAIIISFGARGVSSEHIAKLLKKNKTPINLITSTLENPLEKYAQYILYMSSYEDHYNKISSFATRLSLLYLLDCLYTCYFRLDYQKNIDKKLNYYETMTRQK